MRTTNRIRSWRLDINYSAPLNSLGYGQVGLNLLVGLEQEGYNVAWWPIGQSEVPQKWMEVAQRANQRAALFNPRAPSLRLWHQHALAESIGRGIRVGFPIFELDKFNPVELHHLQSCDRLIVCSRWAKEVLAREHVLSPDCVYIAPLGVDLAIFDPSKFAPRPVGDNTTVFLNLGKWEIRKGHDFLCEAFTKAFSPQDDIRLDFCCHNPFLTPKANGEWANLFFKSSLGKAGKVRIYGRLPSQDDVAALMANADCGIFPARAEGWGLESLEMMAMGKNVIMTNYAGHTEYTNAQNAHLIDVEETEEAFDGIFFRGGCGSWAQLGISQLEQTITLLRGIHKAKQEGSLTSNIAGISTTKEFSWQRTARSVANALS